MSLLVALAALGLERLAGYPPALVRAIGHPVIWIGWLIGAGEKAYNNADWSFEDRRFAGALVLAGVLAVVLVVTLPLTLALRALPWGWALEAVLASSLLAQKELWAAVGRVGRGLETSLDAGRHAVSQIVGRDTTELDGPEISRAAIETLAENTSDGVIAPLLYLALLGLPGIALYKAINTADSMVGYRSDRYLAFGWASARTDDFVNFLPARLTALLFALAAALDRSASGRAAWRTARRDAGKHASPNAGWPEAAMAGALGLSLGGPRAYGGRVLDLPTMGDGRRSLGPSDIVAALGLYRTALWLTLGAMALVTAGWFASSLL
ncbi:adenosylcobinamide-phosphate synthase CbiB [Pelagibacterium montanilacus]|uniref:adenosylcobinamide-phosphate synthase CbiB n=1 Tax=Pelagibacterium montanilacus TaxID=2185280 RepID=UPI000F8CEC42|nr:adenosylcobinamide-phosphate synthase CbiB [Pelagibacterium montanilacus]